MPKTKIAKDKNKKKKILSGFIIYYEKIYRNIFSLLCEKSSEPFFEIPNFFHTSYVSLDHCACIRV